ncbi:hypothetical protein [Tichowtungia aerotolerans]|uniref:Uncharacterized protein n=1 Tax=Tichowtungia aerotolerans TaxID=2697043 RepID=A0A6P1M961_9BACT|nr:hypothetical protein [Tichowtungia aerotolerans]QHI69084.1 hypothetical protein GT409_06365 [Tichowtungia aerotolerans]
MKRYLVTMIVAMMATLSTFALPLEWWDMSDTAGTDLNDLSNSGTLASVWNFNTVGAVTDGNGLFVISGDSGTTTRKMPKKGTANAEAGADVYASPITVGAYSLTVDFAAWSLDASSLGDVWKLKAQDSSGTDIAGIEFGMDSTTTARLRMWNLESDGAAYRSYSFDVTSASGTVAEVQFDFDNGTVAYVVDDVEQYSAVDFIGTELAGLIYTTSGDGTADWATAASSISIDAMGLDVLSGPAPSEDNPVIIVAQSGDTLNNVPETVIITTFDADTGDVLVFGASGSNNNHIQQDAVNWVSADGGAVDVTVLTNKAAAAMWYTTVTTGGTFNVEFNKTNNYTSVGAYQIRALDPGSLQLDVQGSYVSGDISNTTAETTYNIGTDAAVGLVEVISTTSAGITTNEGVTLDYVNSPPKRGVGSAAYTNLSSLITTWTTDQSTVGYIALVGIAAYLQSTNVVATPESLYADWLGGETVNTNLLEDVDGDGVNNLVDYAVGGSGNLPVSAMDASYMTYVHVQWDETEAALRGLSYDVQATSNLVSGTWSTNGVEFVGSAADTPAAGYLTVTNRIPVSEMQDFLRLHIEFTP